ncbi:hypothetical protein QWM81_15815 [Streptomyces ficellus]|uniref:Lipoprotein n=1 Tax=Streptomyces ficellus TaxID=1977088 RepID=A0ABT7Z7K8_9ACTN|nr:hypothetical protein [Streptomyces ficellus]MDN3295490.1 hypothetical protein [Streptomyces ficellus]
MWVPRRAVAVAAGLVLVSGCTAQEAPGTAQFQSAVDRRAAAVRAEELAGVPLGSWSYRVTRVRRDGDRATARAELSYRIAGYDSGAVTGERVLELAERDGRWYVTSDRPAQGAAQHLWEQGDIQVVRGRNSLVLGVGQDAARLKSVAAAADRAVPAVSDAWPGGWARRVVVLVPASLKGMGALLGEPAAGYRGIAAVTTGRVGGGADAPADRVIVNPEAYAVLGEFGQGVVLAHETAHVASRAYTSAATPLWLSEGFADWVAYRGTGRPAARVAPELRAAVRAGDVPDALPDDEDFRFGGSGRSSGGDAGALARAYEAGWLACALIADRWGEAKLTAFYRAVGKHEKRAGAVEEALREVLSTTPEAFTAQWRGYLREQLG